MLLGCLLGSVGGCTQKPAPSREQIPTISNAATEIDLECTSRRHPPPGALLRRQTHVLLRAYKATPEGEFQFDDSSPPTTMEEVITNTIIGTVGTPCAQVAKSLKRGLGG